MKLDTLLERKRPDLNIKENPIDILKEYQNEHGVFVTFHRIDKIGINPQKHDYIHNPLGIYSYPIKFVLEKTQDGYYDLTDTDLFASDSSYVSLISQHGNILNLTDPAPSHIKALDTISNRIIRTPGFDKKGYEEVLNFHLPNKLDESSIKYKWYKIISASQTVHDSRAKLTKRFLESNVHCVADYGSALLSVDIEQQAVHLTTRSLEVIKMMYNK